MNAMASPPPAPNFDPLLRWCRDHPRSVLWILFATTANLVLNILNTLGVI